MKRKVLAMMMSLTLAMAVTACGGSDTETDAADTAVEETVDDTAEADEAELINEEKNFSVEFYMVFDDSYESYKWAASESGEGYKEVKYSGYEGYMQLHDEFEYEVCLKLADEGDYQVYLFAYVAPGSDLIDTETTDIEAIFNQQEVQDILNSVKYKGIENSSK